MLHKFPKHWWSIIAYPTDFCWFVRTRRKHTMETNKRTIWTWTWLTKSKYTMVSWHFVFWMFCGFTNFARCFQHNYAFHPVVFSWINIYEREFASETYALLSEQPCVPKHTSKNMGGIVKLMQLWHKQQSGHIPNHVLHASNPKKIQGSTC